MLYHSLGLDFALHPPIRPNHLGDDDEQRDQPRDDNLFAEMRPVPVFDFNSRSWGLS